MDAETQYEACEKFLAVGPQDYDDKTSALLRIAWRAGANWMIFQAVKHPERVVGWYDEMMADFARLRHAPPD